jgi:hypothetical protein
VPGLVHDRRPGRVRDDQRAAEVGVAARWPARCRSSRPVELHIGRHVPHDILRHVDPASGEVLRDGSRQPDR